MTLSLRPVPPELMPAWIQRSADEYARDLVQVGRSAADAQDIGYVPPDGTTPRQASRQIGHAAYLTPGENEALGRVVATVELARYARPGTDLHDVSDDAQAVWRGALSRRRRLDRARALLLPAEGRGLWRSVLRGRTPTRRRTDPPQDEP